MGYLQSHILYLFVADSSYHRYLALKDHPLNKKRREQSTFKQQKTIFWKMFYFPRGNTDSE